ncbi:MAG: hypothetical protein LBS63_02370 [Prevotellaceae bacterium]|jgi:hypothetical protein|nr:hypothetical protein [Prevotellaceae bacterium]
MKHVFFPAMLALLLSGCGGDGAKLDKVKLTVEVRRFEQDLFALNPDSLRQQVPALHAAYGEFFVRYCEDVISVGSPQDAEFFGYLASFLRDEVAQESYREAQAAFPDDKALNRRLTNAFKRYKLHFPEAPTPQVVTYVSGFNQPVVLLDSLVGVGLDKYLGAGHEVYAQLGFYKYLVRNMYPAKIPADVALALAKGLFPYRAAQDELLGRMVWEGRALYFAKQLLPSEPDTAIFGFSKVQLGLCAANEAYMWLTLVEGKLLFSVHPFTIAKFTDERPFTQEFSREAPGRAACWLGYRLVSRYMKRHPDVTLPQLMRNDAYRQIFEQSGYNPR